MKQAKWPCYVYMWNSILISATAATFHSLMNLWKRVVLCIIIITNIILTVTTGLTKVLTFTFTFKSDGLILPTIEMTDHCWQLPLLEFNLNIHKSKQDKQ